MDFDLQSDYSIRNLFEPELEVGEGIEWIGRPDLAFRLRAIDVVLMAFGLLFGGSSTLSFIKGVWALVTHDPGLPMPFGLFSLFFNVPFMLIGLYIAFGRLFVNQARKRNLYYAVTNKRVMMLSAGRNRVFQAKRLSDISSVGRRVTRSGNGTIAFGAVAQGIAVVHQFGLDLSSQAAKIGEIVFVDVRDAETVASLIESRLRRLESVPQADATSIPEAEPVESSDVFGRPTGEPDAAYLPPPPRPVPLSARLVMLFGGCASLFGWLWFGFSMIFFWAFAMNADISGPVLFLSGYQTCTGKILSIERTNFSSGEDGPPVRKYAYSYSPPASTELRGVSYSSGFGYKEGDSVTIDYLARRPSVSRIHGMDRKPVGWPVIFVCLFPLIGLAFILHSVTGGLRAIHLLRNGKLAYGKLKSMEETGTKINEQPVYKFVFEFKAEDGRMYEAVAKTHQTEDLKDQVREPLVYLPADPHKAVLLDSLPGNPRLDEFGNIKLKNYSPFALPFILFLPMVTLLGHGWYVYTRFFK